MGDDVTLVSSAEETAKDVYRVLTRADLLRDEDGPPPRAPVPRHRRPRAVRPARPPLPRARGRRRAARRIGGRRVKLTVVGCSGSGPGPTSPASCYLVEHDGFRLLLDLGNGAFGAAAGDRRPGRRSTRSSSPTCTPTTASTSRRSSCGTATPGRRRRSLVPLYAPVGAERRLALAYDRDGDGLDRRVRLRAGRARARSTLGPVRGRRLARTAHPVECYADPADRRRPVAGLHRRHRPVRARRRAGPRRRRAAGRGGPPAGPGPAARAAPHRPARPASTPPRPGWAGCCSPTSRPGSTPIGQLVAASAVFPETELVAPRAPTLRDLRPDGRWPEEENGTASG